MKFNYTQSYKLKLSNIKDKNSFKIKDFENFPIAVNIIIIY